MTKSKVLELIPIVLILMSFTCTQAANVPATENIIEIEGQVIAIHIMGQVSEKVMICDFDPRFVVVVDTANGTHRLAIHSPTRTFTDEKPVGNTYRFVIEKSDQSYLMKKITKLNP